MQSARDEGTQSGPKGGQFALGGGRVGGHGKQAHTKPAAHHHGKSGHAKAAGPLGFDGKRGAGYGIKGGDPRVRSLQQAMNRFGLTDASGKPLAVDGKFGPRTTAAVKKAQKALGMEQTGKVTEEFIKALAGAKSLRDLHPKPTAHKTVARKPMHRSATEPYGHDADYADPGYQDDGKHRYPLDTEAHCRAAWSYINQADNADAYSAEQLAHIKGRIKAALRKYGVEVNDDDTTRSRSPLLFDRAFPLDDIVVRSGGDGRTVEAYAAMFDTPYEVRDQHGHYMEVIDRAAFNRTLAHNGPERVAVLYNHGMTLHGTPSDMWSVPIGRALEIKPDGRGLYTVTRYNMSPEADRVLESIRNGEIRAQSFRGRIYRSDPRAVPRSRAGGPLPTITRHELGLSDYGPTPIPVNATAEIMAVRSLTEFVDDFERLDDVERAELLHTLNLASTPDGDPDVEDPETATPDDSGPGAEDPPQGHSGRLELARARLRAELIVKGLRNAQAA